MTIYLRTSVTTEPDLSGFDYYLQAGDDFDADNFADVFDLALADIDPAAIAAAVTRAAGLADDEWMKVEVAGD